MSVEENWSSLEWVSRLISLVDLTRLPAQEVENESEFIANLCAQAQQPLPEVSSNSVAAVCCWPQRVSECTRLLDLKQNQHNIAIATVIDFPSGSGNTEKVIQELHAAVADGADEIDWVFPYSRWLSGDQKQVREHCNALQQAVAQINSTRENPLLTKVILETACFKQRDDLFAAAQCCVAAGVNFLKTSTGFGPGGATAEAVDILCDVINQSENNKSENNKIDKQTNSQTNVHTRKVGLKISGGVADWSQAISFAKKVVAKCGPSMLHKSRLRFGASRLLSSEIPAKNN